MAKRQKIASINCQVCTEQFSHEKGHIPRIIPCGHTFCESCLEKLRVAQPLTAVRVRGKLTYKSSFQICCPKCKNQSALNTSSYTLPKNFSYLDLIEDVLASQRNQSEPCEEHPNYILDMFCHDEEEAVCLKCTIFGKHKAHRVSTLSGFSDHQKTSIKYSTSCLEEMIKDCQTLEEALQKRKSEIEEKVDEVRQYITAKFSSIQEGIKTILDTKLQTVLKELDKMYTVQSNLLDENVDIALDTWYLETLKDKSESFLSKASEYEIAKEKELLKEMETSLENIRTCELNTQYMYEVRIDDSDQILEILRELLDAWVCKVYETKPAKMESMVKLLENHSQCFGKSLRILFGDEEPDDEFHENPFENIGCSMVAGH